MTPIHTHNFKHIGGGCAIEPANNKACDDDYRCYCGASFRVFTSMAGHYYLPESFEAQELSEIKKAELDTLEQALKNNLSKIPPPNNIIL